MTSRLAIWRRGDTPNPGWSFYDGDGEPIDAVDVIQFVCVFMTDDGTELVKFSKTPIEGYTVATKTTEEVDAVEVDVFRFPIQDSNSWPEEGKVRMVLKVKLTSNFFPGGYKKVFNDFIAQLGEGDDTEL